MIKTPQAMRYLYAAGAIFAAFVASPTAAQTAPPAGPSRVGGTIQSYDPLSRMLSVATRDHKSVSVALEPNLRVMYQADLALSDLTAGEYVGVTTLKTASGLRALEIHVFPGEFRGAAEGVSSEGDASSNRAVVNGTISAVTSAAANRGSISLSYHGAATTADGSCGGRAAPAAAGAGCSGQETVEVVPGIPIIALMDGDESLLVPGAAVLLSASAGENGELRSSRLSVEKDGVKPIM